MPNACRNRRPVLNLNLAPHHLQSGTVELSAELSGVRVNGLVG